jgi:PST family polysaccharide transporter
MSIRSSLLFVYAAYGFRYIYLLILIPFYAQVLGPEVYGKVLAGMSLFNVVLIITIFGTQNTGMRNIAGMESTADYGVEFGRQLKARLLLALPGAAVGAIATVASPLLREEPVYGVLATILGLVSALNLGWYFQGTQRFRTSVSFEVAGFVISLSLILTLVKDGSDGALVFVALLLSACITTFSSYVLALKQMGLRSVRFEGALTAVREATPIFMSSGLTRLSLIGSTLLLSFFADAEQVAYYGIAERLTSLVVSLMVPANQVMISTISREMGSAEGNDRAFYLARKSLVILLSYAILATVAMHFIAQFAVVYVLGENYGPVAGMIQVLSLVIPIVAFNQVIRMYVFLPMKLDGCIARATVTGLLTNLLLVMLLAPVYQGYGMAVARIAGEIATVLLLFVYLQKNMLVGRILKA